MDSIHIHGNEIHQGPISRRGHIMPGVENVVPSVPGMHGPIPYLSGTPDGRDLAGFFSPGMGNPVIGFSTIGRYDRPKEATGVYSTNISRYVRR